MRVEPDCLIACLRGLLVAPQRIIDQAQICVRFGEIGLDSNRLLVGFRRFRGAAQFILAVAGMEPRLRQMGVFGNRHLIPQGEV